MEGVKEMPSIEYPRSVDIEDTSKAEKVEKIVSRFKLSDSTLQRIADICETEMTLGLSDDSTNRKASSLLMMNTYVTDVLNGSEKGNYLALDLGGTQFRILYLSIEQDGRIESQVWKDEIPQQVLTGPSEQLFDYIATSIYNFQAENNRLNEEIPLGFTFSFPMKQEAINVGKLVTWTKSFKCSDGVGEDAVKLLEDAINRRQDLHVPVVAILNDTTGALMAGTYHHPDTCVGLILGTGCNACYIESVHNLRSPHHLPPDTKQVIIDTESGGFGDNGCLDFFKTSYDFAVDQESNHPKSYSFEKLFSGHYLGELIRKVIIDLTQHNLLFNGELPEALRATGSLKSAHISRILSDNGQSQEVFNELGLPASVDDQVILKYLSEVISIRGAHVVAAKLSCIVRHCKKSELSIAVDGSLYEKHPHFGEHLNNKLAKMVTQIKCKLFHVTDGSGLGAALTAAVADRQTSHQS